MTAMRKIGIALMVIAVVLLGIVIVQIQANLAQTGAMAGKIVSYKPPFTNHGLWVVLGGIGSAFAFLGGAVMTVLGKNK